MSKPKSITKILVDGDIICYRAAAGTEGSHPDDTIDKVDTLMNFIVAETVVFPTSSNLECYLTGKGNFRYEVAKTTPYKGNRKDVVKPTNLPLARQHLIDKWGAVVSQGEEADDLIGIASARGDPETTVVVTIDKDMMQLQGWNWNFVKDVWTKISVDEGNKFFYTQILTGDRADNIRGIHGIGPVKAAKVLEGRTTEEELYKACVDIYVCHWYADHIDYEYVFPVEDWAEQRVLENARLLWLRRYPNEMWSPPNGS